MKLQQMKSGSLYIVLQKPAGQFVKLEDFLSLGLQNAPRYYQEGNALLPVASKSATETPKEPGKINLPTLEHSKTT